jgi:hypothetical protein
VRKWTGVPSAVSATLSNLRSKTQAYQDVLSIIFAPKKSSADKVQKILESMSSQQLPVPAAAHAVYFRLLADDLALFSCSSGLQAQSVPDLAEFFDPNTGYLKDVDCEKSEVEDLIKESLGNVLRGWVAKIEIVDGNLKEDSKEPGDATTTKHIKV